MKTTTEQQQELLTLTYGEHVGLNADWSVMAWKVNEQIYIIDPEDGGNAGEYAVIEDTENLELTVLFTGNAAQCIEYCNQF